MTLLSGPEWLVSTHPTTTYGTWSLLSPGAHVLTVRYQYQILLAGGNAAIFIRLFDAPGPSLAGAALVGGTTVFAALGTAPVDFTYDTTLITQPYVTASVTSNTPGNTNGVYQTVFDDVGFSSSITASGCCHDPMLDAILAAVQRIYLNAP